MKERYLGSVRFFKNLILLAVCISIIIPSVFAFKYKSALNALSTSDDLSPNDPLDPDISDQTSSDAEMSEKDLHNSDPDNDSSENSIIDAELPEYASKYPDFYAPQPLSASESEEHTAFLTFDDGPSERTNEILHILDDKGVKATFFVIGKSDEMSIQRMQDIVDAGHTLAMHSYSHNYKKIYESVDAYLDDMYQLFCLIRDNTGVAPTVFRLPGGSINAHNRGIYQEILAEMLRRGFVPCDWNVSSEDATGKDITTNEMISIVTNRASSVKRAFVLMHDTASKKTTVSALPGIIDRLKELGYTLLPIDADTKPVLFGYSD